MSLYIGLLSGTSMDGIDAALVDTKTHQLIAGLTQGYRPKTCALLSDALSSQTFHLQQFYKLNILLGEEFAAAVLALLDASKAKAADIVAIGSHGQTIYHQPKGGYPYTVQLGCPHRIAEACQMTVVADFRSRDLALGGQGAPFAPIYHQALFQNHKLPLAVVNIGGIANISYLESKTSVFGYDIGPGNCLMDAWIQCKASKPYDQGGEWAKKGKLIEALLEAMLSAPFFQEAYPKSIDKSYFSLSWLQSLIQDKFYRDEDIQQTLVHFTALSIAQAVKEQPLIVDRIIICGGGAHNSHLMKTIASYLPNHQIASSNDYQINPDFIEAMLFAWLADKAIHNQPIDLSKITGAKHATILGVIYPFIR